MSLAQVRQHPWFVVELPGYLKPLPESTDIESLAALDESIVGELERQLEMDRTSLVAQLRQRGTNPAKVAYQLTLDNRHMLAQSRNSNRQGIRHFAMASSPPAAFHTDVQAGALSQGTSTSNPVTSPQPGSAGARLLADDDDHTPSSIGVLGSSLPRSAGHALESQMYKMRLRGPHAQAGAGSADATAARVQSPLVPSQQQPKAMVRLDAAAAILAQQAVGNSGTSPAGTPPNYFRAALPPLSGTPGNLSNSSSISSLAHASAKAPPANNGNNNPYSHRPDSANMTGIVSGATAAAAPAAGED
ncbi:Protein kinase, partial [Coemansia helicoidea]